MFNKTYLVERPAKAKQLANSLPTVKVNFQPEKYNFETKSKIKFTLNSILLLLLLFR